MSAREAFKVDILLCYITALVGERERERESTLRERIKGVVVAVTVLTLPFELSFVGQSEEKKRSKMHLKKEQSGGQKRKSLLSYRTRLSLLHSFARARYTHTRFYRAVILSRIHTRYKRETTKTAKREGGRGVLFLWWFCASQRVKERARCLLFFPTGSSFTVCCGGNLVKR